MSFGATVPAPVTSIQESVCARRSDDTEASSTRLGASVDPTEARKDAGHARAVGGTELE